MQDTQLIGVDRRLRQTHLQNQALRCPRCDSLNTKFCYYNNYNLSQPRHFCKSCRRYWTKGGVLRNVPVGGGCRKSSKRSSKSTDELRWKPKSNTSISSSESSNLTGTGNAAVKADPIASAVTPPCTEAVSRTSFGDGKYIFQQIRNPDLASELIIPEIGYERTKHNCITTSYDMDQWQLSSEQGKLQDAAGGGYIDPTTVQIDRSSNLDYWHQEQQMFGLNSADVEDQGYWCQQWSNADPLPHLYLP